MRHAKRSFKVGRNTSHRRSLMANSLKSLIEHGRIETTVTKAKELRRYADKMVTLAKKDTLASKRLAIGRMMVSFNALSSKDARKAKGGNLNVYNTDRKVVGKLFGELKDRYKERNGGYTRIIKKGTRIGDNAPKCFIEFV
ncbi:50S ribosomal protein L17 [Candidatus Aerophobetes bacterium]|uniref:Large ribosomal subunit protein bL17 n=1 Tax=Aerophobetes bacterium TaxID=2030807 RepID=A0A2A4YMK9_UNCAE|nr:MAG: 50S ribosomal protein L17 [Candidatus Aerophobetes bacterium]